MKRIWNRGPAMVAAAVIAVAAIALAGCRDDGPDVSQHQQPRDTVVTDGGASLSSIAPNTFLTYEGKQYRLVDLQQADLIEDESFQRVGTATEADIDQDDLTVFKRDGDSDAVYTYAKERAENDAVGTAEGSAATTPALWYRWRPD